MFRHPKKLTFSLVFHATQENVNGRQLVPLQRQLPPLQPRQLQRLQLNQKHKRSQLKEQEIKESFTFYFGWIWQLKIAQVK